VFRPLVSGTDARAASFQRCGFTWPLRSHGLLRLHSALLRPRRHQLIEAPRVAASRVAASRLLLHEPVFRRGVASAQRLHLQRTLARFSFKWLTAYTRCGPRCLSFTRRSILRQGLVPASPVPTPKIGSSCSRASISRATHRRGPAIRRCCPLSGQMQLQSHPGPEAV